MHIVIANMATVPVFAYGGTERVVWDLAKGLVERGHRVTFLVPAGSSCDFAQVIAIDPAKSWRSQIPSDADVVHFNFLPEGVQGEVPYLVTEHGNAPVGKPLDPNTVFVSRNHAQRHGSQNFVYNGLDWRAYGPVDWHRQREGVHFLGKAAWRVKNVVGAIDVARRAGVRLHVLGGDRFNFKRGIRLTFSPRVHFHGMVGGQVKTDLLNQSQALVLPVRWHEPFGLAVIESMYFGCPVFATPYGALPELVPAHMGCLSDDAETLAAALREAVHEGRYEQEALHAHVVEHFNAGRMTDDYLTQYQRVIRGEQLNAQVPMLRQPCDKLPWQ